MKKLILISTFFVAITGSTFATTHNITNGFNVFTPATINAMVGDTVVWTLAPSHDVVEVSQATWGSNGNTPLAGGFSLPNGGGMYVLNAGDVGALYYVCTPHASMGMKGMINVSPNTMGIEAQQAVSMQVMQSVQDQLLKLNFSGATTGKVHVDMLNLSGQVVKTVTMNLEGETSSTIEVSDMPKGVYMIRWSYGSVNKAKKIILQ